MTGSHDPPVDIHFVRAVRNALHHLYNPSELRKNPLLALFVVEEQGHPPTALRTLFFAAIRTLKPEAQTPTHTKGWRFYHILLQRFQEQYTQQEVATDLGLSIRHLRREEALAVRLLAEELWVAHHFADHWPRLLTAAQQPPPPDWLNAEAPPGWRAELARLQAEQAREPVALVAVIQDVLALLQPLAQAAAVQIECTLGPPHLLVDAQRTALRQTLLHLCGAAIQMAPEGQLWLTTSVQAQTVQIELAVAPVTPLAPRLNAEVAEALTIAQQLSEFCAGVLTMTHPTTYDQRLLIQFCLPLFKRIPVLTIDDNRDTLQLLQRYLAHSQYHFIGVADPQQAIATAEKYHPQVILLDVMLPEVDGWELLGRLRQHPVTSTAPIIVCTILPQQQLALALGAAAFLRKPVNQQTLLATLDHQVGYRAREFL